MDKKIYIIIHHDVFGITEGVLNDEKNYTYFRFINNMWVLIS